MTVPGVNLIYACSSIAAVGDPHRFPTSCKLVAYLGLDPKVRQSGETPARSGRISKRGSASARWGLVEAAWSVVLQPGPLHAFYERTKNRRGHGKAIVATAANSRSEPDRAPRRQSLRQTRPGSESSGDATEVSADHAGHRSRCFLTPVAPYTWPATPPTTTNRRRAVGPTFSVRRIPQPEPWSQVMKRIWIASRSTAS